MTIPAAEPDCDYLVVGSGAGGGTLAARLAEGGASIVLLEAGGDPRDAAPRMPDDYDVPAFHPLATENPAIAWNYFVRHYDDPVQQARDPKAGPDGVLYPRAGTLGGCTAHNAMIFVCPEDAEWNLIAAATGDRSWRARPMRKLLHKLENCHHRPEWRWLGKWFGINPSGHGWGGWLSTEHVKPREIFSDAALLGTVLESAYTALHGKRLLDRLWRLFEDEADPNDRGLLRRAGDGVCYTPMTTRHHRRIGARERVLEVQQKHPDRLRVELHALATRIILENGRATGIAYLKGAQLYRTGPSQSSSPGEPRTLRARHGVIVCGGAFNTPQLLKLSGIGPPAELRGHGIEVRTALDGVGCNLQDRYEISVINRMTENWRALAGARFSAGDPLYREWAGGKAGMYASNGAALAVSRRSSAGRTLPDLFCMALVGRFRGYYPGYSADLARRRDCLSWVVLKAHTRNRSGTVTLRSADPRDAPVIRFNAFDPADDPEDTDLAAVVGGIRFVRGLAAPLYAAGVMAQEELPGRDVQSDAALRQYVRDNAWGHHACGSCAIGEVANAGVLTSDFRVHGIEGLRVVDASVFPRIPGFFIASAVYLVAEKAAGVILREYRDAR